MPVVRIPDDVFDKCRDVAVKATIASQAPVKESEIVVGLLRMATEDKQARVIVKDFLKWLQENNLKE